MRSILSSRIVPSCGTGQGLKAFAAITSELWIFPWVSLSPNPGNPAFFNQLSKLLIAAAFRRGECDAELARATLFEPACASERTEVFNAITPPKGVH